MNNTSRKPVLVVVYNHSYPANIAKIEYLYSKRFSRIYDLMPFYFPDKSVDAELAKRIIPVFDNSYYFQGVIATSYNTYHNEDASHYVFVMDDLILNPEINEDNNALFYFNVLDKPILDQATSKNKTQIKTTLNSLVLLKYQQ